MDQQDIPRFPAEAMETLCIDCWSILVEGEVEEGQEPRCLGCREFHDRTVPGRPDTTPRHPGPADSPYWVRSGRRG